MASVALEQMLENNFVPNIARNRIYQKIDKYTSGATQLYSFDPPKPDKLIIYDMPSVNGQVHLHENKLGITDGRLYSYDRIAYKSINAYEGAMLDFYAKELGIKKK